MHAELTGMLQAAGADLDAKRDGSRSRTGSEVADVGTIQDKNVV